MQDAMTRALDEAARIGRENGRAAASWVFDGNTSRATYAKVLKGILDGDPEVMDAYREPSLSGEYACDYTSDALMCDLGLDPDLDYQGDTEEALQSAEARAELEEMYEQTARDTFWWAIEEAARKQIMPDTQRNGDYWIAYFGDGYPGSRDCTPEAFRTLEAVKEGFKSYARAVGRDYYDPYGTANGTVYHANGDDMWFEALRFDGTGVPFDYPDFTIGYGPRGGVRLERA